MKDFVSLIHELEREHILPREELRYLIVHYKEAIKQGLLERAREVADRQYGKEIYIRGLIEFSNYCKNDCYYCGIRRSNLEAQRYRLSLDQILQCCKTGYELGFRTFVLQGGEDGYYTDDRMVEIIECIRGFYPACAITISFGEKSRETYQKYYDAGANRYLLRHETANAEHYARLHPEPMKLSSRMQCLRELKEIGFQVGCGFMVGSPYQTVDHIVEDLNFIYLFQPDMVGIGPYLPHSQTPFADKEKGSFELTLALLAVVRLMKPNMLLPSTTALGTISPTGREQGILAGGNVVMPNLSPVEERSKYTLYDNKICMGDEAAECKYSLEEKIESIGYKISVNRGDPVNE